MLKTELPNKQEWAEQIDLIRKGAQIDRKELARHSDVSDPTLRKVLNGEGSYEQLQQIESALKDMLL